MGQRRRERYEFVPHGETASASSICHSQRNRYRCLSISALFFEAACAFEIVAYAEKFGVSSFGISNLVEWNRHRSASRNIAETRSSQGFRKICAGANREMREASFPSDSADYLADLA
jgi:hypothetical protein